MTRLADLARRAADRTGIAARIRSPRAQEEQVNFAGTELIRAFGAAFPRAVFVEIGANDGEQHDHLRPMILEREWRGVMVEPVPYVFDRLVSNYGRIDRVTLENAAIADRDGRLPFYHLAPVTNYRREGLPQWYDGIGSFSREAVLDHARLIPDIADRLVETLVPALTFDSLCAKHGLDVVDLVLIDTEGYDYEILQHIDFATHRPVLVGYEHYHLTREDRDAALTRMRDAGYETLQEGFDTWCLRPEARDQLTETWRALRPAVPPVSVWDEPR
jgi:FkbM family methyltransferase